ncbi:hypothetical protein BC1002_2424 [Paraburkholderia atlantica]|uniref:Uncharacterized protein n=1 Tax=Paraburkholderia atlantica TaxID=2654982 RepID=D5WBU8_PARAM|nr:hypothetical protein BC1002_2424 [Paraburkholderia atlantica]
MNTSCPLAVRSGVDEIGIAEMAARQKGARPNLLENGLTLPLRTMLHPSSHFPGDLSNLLYVKLCKRHADFLRRLSLSQ